VEAEELLNQLADIHLPAAVSYWPPAPGWWLLLALLLAGLGWIAFGYYRRWQQKQRLLQALAGLDLAWQTYLAASSNEALHNKAGLDLLYSCNSLLKRVAMTNHPDSEVAALSGQAWLDFLDTSGKCEDFTKGAGKVLADGEYKPRFDADAQALEALVRSWITQQYPLDAPRKSDWNAMAFLRKAGATP
jgi:hypothetical protein